MKRAPQREPFLLFKRNRLADPALRSLNSNAFTMPLDFCRNLGRQFAIGSALGALLATALFAGEAYIFRIIQHGAAPDLMATVVATCFTLYCGTGATLSGFLLIVTEES